MLFVKQYSSQASNATTYKSRLHDGFFIQPGQRLLYARDIQVLKQCKEVH